MLQNSIPLLRNAEPLLRISLNSDTELPDTMLQNVLRIWYPVTFCRQGDWEIDDFSFLLLLSVSDLLTRWKFRYICTACHFVFLFHGDLKSGRASVLYWFAKTFFSAEFAYIIFCSPFGTLHEPACIFFHFSYKFISKTPQMICILVYCKQNQESNFCTTVVQHCVCYSQVR